MISEPVLVAIIGVVSALSVIIIKDVIVQPIYHRVDRRRTLLQMRLEKAYVPLEYLSFQLIGADQQQQERLVCEIGDILQHYGHLLSDSALSAFYTLCEDVNVGASMLQQSFVPECAELKRHFYHLWHSPYDPDDSGITS